MGGRASKQKGSRGELEVISLLEPWWATFDPTTKWARTPGSGGWGTPESRGAFKAAGDIMTTSTAWPFDVEVKRREGWTDTAMIDGKGPVWGWWRQCQQSARETGREPMLWFRRSRQPWRVFLRADIYPIALATKEQPLVLWNECELRRVDYGSALPECWAASTLLGIKAERFAYGVWRDTV